jgi:hypothetical protein
MMGANGVIPDRRLPQTQPASILRMKTKEVRMASLRHEIVVSATPEYVWDCIRDVGALHRRLVPGFVADCKLEGDARIVTFANGLVARELIVDLDEASRRLVWSARGGRLSHHNASVQVFAQEPAGSRIVWIADLLPNEMAPAIDGMIGQAMSAMKNKLEGSATAASSS